MLATASGRVKQGVSAHGVAMLSGAFTWAFYTVLAAGIQTLRNAMQRHLVSEIGTAGATQVRFLFGLPFAMIILAGYALATQQRVPMPDLRAFGLCLAAAFAQVLATGLMLAAMRDRSFVVATAYTKTEPVQVAVFGLVVLGDGLSAQTSLAIVIATFGVMLCSWPRAAPVSGSPADIARETRLQRRAALLGLASGACFALSSIGFRGAILALEAADPVATSGSLAATTILVLGLALQTVILAAWLAAFDRETSRAILRMWRPSMLAGFLGAAATEFWFLAFALTSAARVRTLGLVEVIFAQIVSRRLFSEGVSRREFAGILLIMIGVGLLVSA